MDTDTVGELVHGVGKKTRSVHVYMYLAVEVDHVEGFHDDLDLDVLGIHVLAASSGEHLMKGSVRFGSVILYFEEKITCCDLVTSFLSFRYGRYIYTKIWISVASEMIKFNNKKNKKKTATHNPGFVSFRIGLRSLRACAGSA